MKEIYNKIQEAKQKGKKLLAILLDPDKVSLEQVEPILEAVNSKKVDVLLVGGSTVALGITQLFVHQIKRLTKTPVILFPGDYTQITSEADAILFLTLLSGRNPEYLVEQQIKSVPFLQKTKLEIISTGYILIDGGKQTAVERVSKTKPIDQNNIELIVQTAVAGMYLGNKLIYLEAGSGAKNIVGSKIISNVKKQIDIPLIVGGGIRTQFDLQEAYNHGADMVVIGTAFEENNNFLNQIITEKNESIH